MNKLIVFLLLMVSINAQAKDYSDAQVLRAFSFVESRHRVQIVGDNGLAWGKFQFHKARYTELGGKNWGAADEIEQNRVMLKEVGIVRRLLTKDKYKNVEFVTALATYHNLGHIENKETKYVKKIKAALDFGK
jgi:hypothetical protein